VRQTGCLCVCVSALALAACAGVSPPLSRELSASVRQGKTAVYFSDDVEQIHYLEDVYLVVGVAQVASDSSYTGIWDSDRELSATHAALFNRIGVHAQSLYDALPAEQITAASLKERMTFSIRGTLGLKLAEGDPAAPLSPEFRDALQAQGQDYLIWIAWSGFTLHLQTLALPAVEQYTLAFWIFDVKQNKLLWRGPFAIMDSVRVTADTGKDFLEKDDLAGLRRELTRLDETYYLTNRGLRKSYGDAMGLAQ
jgi:hypothetical protein